MRKPLYYFVGLITLVSCQEDFRDMQILGADEHANYIAISSEELDAPSNAFTEYLNLISNETPWEIVDAPDWLNISPLSGQGSAQIKICGNEYDNADTQREGIFYIKSTGSWSYVKQVKIVQETAAPYLNLSESKIYLNGGENTETVKVHANCKFSTASNDNWLRVTNNDSTLFVSASPNLLSNERTAFIEIMYHETSSQLEVVQIPAKIQMIHYKYENFTGKVETSDDELDLSYYYNECGGHSYYVSIISEAPWEASISGNYTSMQPMSGGIGNTNVTLHNGMLGLYNPTNAKVYIKIGGKTRLTIKFW